jgi:hypothetical protein
MPPAAIVGAKPPYQSKHPVGEWRPSCPDTVAAEERWGRQCKGTLASVAGHSGVTVPVVVPEGSGIGIGWWHAYGWCSTAAR